MSNYALTQTIVTGSDPRALPEFSAIREDINNANHPSAGAELETGGIAGAVDF